MFTALDRVVFDIIRDECEKQKFNLTVALAFADAESNFNPSARSSAGARGLFQVMPFWSSEPEKLKDPAYNTQMGVMILNHYFKRANNNLIMAAKYYNAGPRGKVFNADYVAKINYHIFYFEPQTHSQMMSL
jgi:soluble lytic murein transglycosylase-like protein